MNVNQLLYLSIARPEVGAALVKVANAIEKRAQQNPNAFDEKVSSQPDTKTSNTNDTGMQADVQQDPNQQQQQDPNQLSQEEMMAEQQAQDAQVANDQIDDTNPIAIAQQFLAPVFEAAANGDVHAHATLAKAAAEVGVAVAGKNAEAQAQAAPVEAAPPQDEAAADEQMTPEQTQQAQDFANQNVSPAQQAADRIVPDQQ